MNASPSANRNVTSAPSTDQHSQNNDHSQPLHQTRQHGNQHRGHKYSHSADGYLLSAGGERSPLPDKSLRLAIQSLSTTPVGSPEPPDRDSPAGAPDTPGSHASLSLSYPPRKRLKSGAGDVDIDDGVAPPAWAPKFRAPSPAGMSTLVSTPGGGVVLQTVEQTATPGLTPATTSDAALASTTTTAMAKPSTSSPDISRLSVVSPTTSSVDGFARPAQPQQQPHSSTVTAAATPIDDDSTTAHVDEPTTFYGIDRGLRDLDLPLNDDRNAISPRVGSTSPTLSRPSFNAGTTTVATSTAAGPYGGIQADENVTDDDGCFQNGVYGLGAVVGGVGVVGVRRAGSETSSSGGSGYYDRPVEIRIPKSLEPLPQKLLDNPMNLLYFHHFLNHTAKILVPHDDPRSNPFRNVLPRMAVSNDNLLSLLLAYSASHRARLLGHSEPATRIALWVEDIFPALRAALNDPNQSISDANVATAVMLASLEIVSPHAFGYTIPWQRHLSLARDLIKARPGGLRRMSSMGSYAEDDVCAFLWSWFAYLDVLGSLSAGPPPTTALPLDPFAGPSASSWIVEYDIDEDADADEIDCVMGFTPRGVYLLAKVADLSRRCDEARRAALMQGNGPSEDAKTSVQEAQDPAGDDEEDDEDDTSPRPWWTPPRSVVAQARELEQGMHDSMVRPPRPCRHMRSSRAVGIGGSRYHHPSTSSKWDAEEMAATNVAFHWAGLAHLHRRVLGRSPRHREVRRAVDGILSCLSRIAEGGAAEACLIFPMFTAGCEALDQDARQAVLRRMRSVEQTGMTQVSHPSIGLYYSPVLFPLAHCPASLHCPLSCSLSCTTISLPVSCNICFPASPPSIPSVVCPLSVCRLSVVISSLPAPIPGPFPYLFLGRFLYRFPVSLFTVSYTVSPFLVLFLYRFPASFPLYRFPGPVTCTISVPLSCPLVLCRCIFTFFAFLFETETLTLSTGPKCP